MPSTNPEDHALLLPNTPYSAVDGQSAAFRPVVRRAVIAGAMLVSVGVVALQLGTPSKSPTEVASLQAATSGDRLQDSWSVDYESMSPEDLWMHLDEPENLLGFVKYHMILGLASPGGAVNETMDDYSLTDEYFSPLNCALYDDDEEYPNPQCIKGDNLTCTTGIEENYYYNQTCSKACGESWGVPCGWEALKNLPDVCDDRETGPNNFVAQFPGASKNIEPSQVKMQNLFVPGSEKWYWACNVHAFCYECVDDSNTVDSYCKAAVIRSKSMYAPAAVMKDLDTYWCNQTIFDAIDEGTYCGYDADHLWQCQWNDEVAR